MSGKRVKRLRKKWSINDFLDDSLKLTPICLVPFQPTRGGVFGNLFATQAYLTIYGFDSVQADRKREYRRDKKKVRK